MKSKRALFYVLAALAAGCVPVMSLQPLFTPQTLTYDERLLGSWVNDVNEPTSSWQFSRLGPADQNMLPDALKDQQERIYRLNVQDEKNHKGTFIACLVKLEDRLFLDLYPASFPSGQPDVEKMELFYNAFFFIPAHVFIRVEAIGDQLRLKLTDDEKFKDFINAEQAAIKYETVEDRLILTASTKDLQAFVTKYANDQRLFPNEVVLTRKPSK
jgi:hypothetical protein